jgi:hypothetical protein
MLISRFRRPYHGEPSPAIRLTEPLGGLPERVWPPHPKGHAEPQRRATRSASGMRLKFLEP